jgi:dTDP-4-dehydrorhamnose reductase
VLGTYSSYAAAVPGTEAAHLDITDAEACVRVIGAFKPEVVVHNAAVATTSVCAVNPDLGRAVNVAGTANVLAAAKMVQASLVYVSTDYVFDGTKPHPQRYVEEDPTGPVNNYGLYKLEGEVLVRDSGLPYLITRPARVFGVNWSTPLTSQGKVPEPWVRGSSTYRLVARLRAGERISLPEESYQTPTFATEYSEVVLKLLDRGLTGYYHVACPDEGLGRRAFLPLIARIMGLDEGLIGRCAPEEAEEVRRLPKGVTVRLPDNAALDSSKVERDLGVRIAPLAESLVRFQEEMRQVEAAQEG